MSTEATGDDRSEAVGAVEPDVTAERTDPVTAAAAGQEAAAAPAAAPTAWDAEAPSAWDAPEASGDSKREDEADESSAAVNSAEADDPDEPAADDGYGDEESSEYDEALEHDGEYAEYDEQVPQEVAEARRARRWPRVLLAVGFVVLAAVIVGGAVAIVGSVTHGFKKPVKVTYKKSALFSLKTGECFDPQGQSYSLVPCDSPHEAEVFATFTLSGPTWPGAATVAKEASSGCASRLTGYLNPQLAISLSSTYFYPDSVAWQAGTKTVICEVRATSGQLTGSVRKASATAG
ncbi:MAG: septum formation family protein [Trebonia sp.]